MFRENQVNLLKKAISGQISEIEQNHFISDALGSKQVMLSKQNLQDCSSAQLYSS